MDDHASLPQPSLNTEGMGVGISRSTGSEISRRDRGRRKGPGVPWIVSREIRTRMLETSVHFERPTEERRSGASCKADRGREASMLDAVYVGSALRIVARHGSRSRDQSYVGLGEQPADLTSICGVLCLPQKTCKAGRSTWISTLRIWRRASE